MIMKQHKPTEKEFDDVHGMLNLIDEVLENGYIADDVEDEDFDPDAEYEPPPELMSATQFVERLRQAYSSGGYRWQGVLWAGKTAIDNACDPDATTLEWRKELKAIMEPADTQGIIQAPPVVP